MGVARLDGHRDVFCQHLSIAGDVRRDGGERARERAREHHAEALLPDRRRDERLAAQERVRELVLAQEADDVDPVVGDAEPGEEEPNRERVGTCDREPEPGAAMDLRPGAKQHLQALSRLLSPGEDDPVLAVAGRRRLRGRGRRSESPRTRRAASDSATRFARSETAMRWSIRSMRKPHTCTPYFIQPSSPDAWNVATIGQRARMRAVRQIVGVIGSCRWRTSKRSRSSARVVRKYDAGRQDDVRERPVRGDDHRAPDRDHVRRRVAVTTDARVQDPRELTRRVVPHHQAHVVTELLERRRL